MNKQVLSNVTGKFGELEVINSGSFVDLDKKTIELIKQICLKKGIKEIHFECHWMHRDAIASLRNWFAQAGLTVKIKIGVETFDNDFRENYLNKHADFKEPEEVAAYFDSPCLMVGIKGQTREMIARDIKILKNNFKLGTINVYTDNTTDVKKDPELIQWFAKEYGWLVEDPAVEVLFENTDFGVGD